ncbi:MAG: ABC transporter ATP-binding protein, partial [Actinomycetales bacterium]|nr:ABC transporter ATP-binding protein [Actinomycetales bacterium]
RLIMMHEGRIVLDLGPVQKSRMTVQGLLREFERIKGGELDDTLLQ